MSIRLAVSYAAAGALAVCFASAVSGEARAQANVLKECGSQYQAAKAANELKGQSWQDFLKACRARLAEQPAPPTAATPTPAPAPTPAPSAAAPTPPAAAPTPAPAPAPAPSATAPTPPAATPAPSTAAPAATPSPEGKAAKPAKPASESQAAMRARQKKCGEEWKAQKAELTKNNPKLKWPKYWSDCNKRLKESGQ
jgi:outer membrane biosynthesis protein TonB